MAYISAVTTQKDKRGTHFPYDQTPLFTAWLKRQVICQFLQSLDTAEGKKIIKNL